MEGTFRDSPQPVLCFFPPSKGRRLGVGSLWPLPVSWPQMINKDLSSPWMVSGVYCEGQLLAKACRSVALFPTTMLSSQLRNPSLNVCIKRLGLQEKRVPPLPSPSTTGCCQPSGTGRERVSREASTTLRVPVTSTFYPFRQPSKQTHLWQ